MRREEAWDALEQAEALDAKIRPRGRWYAVYGFGFGLTSMTTLLVIGITNSLTGLFVGIAFYLVLLAVLSVYSHVQPVQPLDYHRLHNWGIGVWTPVYVTAVVVGSIFLRGELLWWVPMAVLTAVPTSVVGLIVLRRSRSHR